MIADNPFNFPAPPPLTPGWDQGKLNTQGGTDTQDELHFGVGGAGARARATGAAAINRRT